VVFTRDGSLAFVADEAGARVTVIDAHAYVAQSEVPLHEDSRMPSGPRPTAMALSPDEKLLFVACGRGGSVAIVDVTRREQLRSIDGVGDRPSGIAVSVDGAFVYTANGASHDVSIVNVATGNVDRRVNLGGLPWAVVSARGY
jgi:YVTN family beta-propeller protein